MNKNIAVTIVVLVVVVIGGYFIFKNNKPVAVAPVPTTTDQQTAAATTPATQVEGTSTVAQAATDIEDPANPEMMIYTSPKLGIQFEYPKVIDFSSVVPAGTPSTVQKITLSESGNRLTISADGHPAYYADIYQKEPNETFAQSIMRQLVPTQYQNNPCTIQAGSGNTYRITFPGDPHGADDIEEPGTTNATKCWSNQDEMYTGNFVADPISGGFYIATRGTQEPNFGLGGTGWWPTNIHFIASLSQYTPAQDTLGYYHITLPPGWKVTSDVVASNPSQSQSSESVVLNGPKNADGTDNTIKVDILKLASTDNIINYVIGKPLNQYGLSLYNVNGDINGYKAYSSPSYTTFGVISPTSGAMIVFAGNHNNDSEMNQILLSLSIKK